MPENLYQKEPNSVWYTKEPIFCDITGKQIKRGYQLKTISGEIIGTYSPYVYQEAIEKLFQANDDEYVLIRMIVFEGDIMIDG